MDCRKKQKAAATQNRAAAAVFPQQKSTKTVLADYCVTPHLSSSPDLRIVSLVSPSRVAPMTGFRLTQDLHAYSGGTVRELHPVFYSPGMLLPHPQALKWNIYFLDSIHDCSGKVNEKEGIFAEEGGDSAPWESRATW